MEKNKFYERAMELDETRKKCLSCFFLDGPYPYVEDENEEDFDPGDPTNFYGFCHRRAPSTVIQVATTCSCGESCEDETTSNSYIWPEVDCSDWCGEWLPREMFVLEDPVTTEPTQEEEV